MHITSSFLLLVWLFDLCLGLSCTLNDCNAACISWEVANTHCQYDFQPYDSKISCQCEYPFQGISSSDKAADLNQCVACNLPNVGPSALSYYQIWTAICDVYAVNGEQAAVSVAGLSDDQIVQAFSTTLLPEISATYCGAAVVTTSMSTSSSTSHLSTSSSASSSFSTSTAQVSVSSSNPISISSSTSMAGSTVNTASTSSVPQPSTSARTSNQAARVGSSMMDLGTTSNLKDLLVVIFIGSGLLIAAL